MLPTMIIGHLAIAGIAKLTWFERANLLFLSMASYGPDLIDKPLSMLFGLSVHGMSHSLIFFVVVVAIACILRRWLKFSFRILVAGTVMWGTHLLGDFVPLQVLLWPFWGQSEPSSKFHIIEKMSLFYGDRLYLGNFSISSGRFPE